MNADGAAILRLRNSAKAIIIQDGAVLLCRCVDGEGDWYVLPGGGQRPGETLIEAVRRECREEVGCDVAVGPLRFVREYIGSRHDFPNFAKDEHQIELMFECRLLPLNPLSPRERAGVRAPDSLSPRERAGVREIDSTVPVPCLGPEPDTQQTGVIWMPLARLKEIRLFPVPLREALTRPLPKTPVYLGAVL